MGLGRRTSTLVPVPVALGMALPGPADKGWCSAGQRHDPGEDNTHDGMVFTEAEVAHGLAHDNIALNGQHHQRPQSNFTYSKWQLSALYPLTGLGSYRRLYRHGIGKRPMH